MSCAICGSAETVKSHIIPRSLFRLERRLGRQVIGSRREGPGYIHLQSGFWDRHILCADHEARLHGPDDYAFRFCRDFVRAVGPECSVTIPNPRPAQLVAFAAACIWRMAVSRSSGRPEVMLGPYAASIQAMLFNGENFDPMLLISRSAYVSGFQPVGLGALPHRYYELGIRFWRFIACGIIFDLKLDNRPAPPAMTTLAVNAAPDITLFPDFPQQVAENRALAASIFMMNAAPRHPKKN